MNYVVLLLGSNLGNKIENIQKALVEIEKYVGNILYKTKMIETRPWGFKSINLFINCAIKIKTNFSPIQLLNIIKYIECKLGRKDFLHNFSYIKYKDRIIDIDIIFYNNIKFWSINLLIPHYLHVKKRNFSKKILKELKNNLIY